MQLKRLFGLLAKPFGRPCSLRLREWGADEYLKITPGGDAKNPEYTMVFNIPRNR